MKNNINKLYKLPRYIRKIYYINSNRLKFYLNNIVVGTNFRVYNKFYLQKHPQSIIVIGNNFTFSSDECFNPLCRNIRGSLFTQFSHSSIIIGNNVGISSSCLWAKENIIIGDNVKIGGDCIIMDTDAHNLDYKIRNCQQITNDIDSISANSAPIIIENDVLIGTRSIILKGVKIGARSIIGSGSVVTKNIPSDCIAAGNPCRVIKFINHNT